MHLCSHCTSDTLLPSVSPAHTLQGWLCLKPPIVCSGFAESLSLHHHLMTFSWKPLSIITGHSHASLRLNLWFCRVLEVGSQYVDQGVWPGHLPSCYQRRFELIHEWFFMAKMPFGQCTRQILFCIITPCMLVILAKKSREGDQSFVLLCLKGTSMGRVFDWVHKEWSKVQACMHQGRILGDGDEHTIIVRAKQELFWFGTHCFSILSGVWGRIKIQLSSPDHLPSVCVRVGRAGDTRKGNLMESPILGDCRSLSKYTSSPLSLSPWNLSCN
jgi:hypothetical protein